MIFVPERKFCQKIASYGTYVLDGGHLWGNGDGSGDWGSNPGCEMGVGEWVVETQTGPLGVGFGLSLSLALDDVSGRHWAVAERIITIFYSISDISDL